MAHAVSDIEFISAWNEARDLQEVAERLGMQKRSCTIRAGRLRALGETLVPFARGPARKHGRGIVHKSLNRQSVPSSDDVTAALEQVQAARLEVSEARGRQVLAEAALARARAAVPKTAPAQLSGAAMHHIGQAKGVAARRTGIALDEDGYPIGYYSPRRAGAFATTWNACSSEREVRERTGEDESSVRLMAVRAFEYGYAMKIMPDNTLPQMCRDREKLAESEK